MVEKPMIAPLKKRSALRTPPFVEVRPGAPHASSGARYAHTLAGLFILPEDSCRGKRFALRKIFE